MIFGTYSTAVTIHKYIYMSVLVLLYISYKLPVFITEVCRIWEDLY